MNSIPFLDDDISILDDAHVEAGSSYGDPAASVPEFQIYSSRPRDVDDASHYALRLTCRTLQKRNKELEQQIAKLHRLHSKYWHISYLQAKNSATSASDHHVNKGPVGGQVTVTDYTKYLEDRVAVLEHTNADLVAELKKERRVISELEELFSALELNMSGFSTGNDNLDVRFTEKFKELKARKDGAVMECENGTREVKDGERMDGHKFDFAEETPSEHLRYSDDTHIKTPSKDARFTDDLLQLYKQLNTLKQTVLLQSNIIKELLKKRTSVQLPDKSDESFELTLVSDQSEAAFQPDGHEQVRLNNDAQHPAVDSRRSGTVYPPVANTCSTQAVVSPSDNRLYTAGLSAHTRTIEIERNINSAEASSPHNRAQNVNLMEMSQEKQIGLDDHQRIVMNNDPLVGTKHIPTHNISAAKTCPLCERSFPAEMKQVEFEYHVNSCLRRSQTDATDGAMTINDEDGSSEVRECPVCNAVLPPDISLSDFELHVNSHFDAEAETLS